MIFKISFRPFVIIRILKMYRNKNLYISFCRTNAENLIALNNVKRVQKINKVANFKPTLLFNLNKFFITVIFIIVIFYHLILLGYNIYKKIRKHVHQNETTIFGTHSFVMNIIIV